MSVSTTVSVSSTLATINKGNSEKITLSQGGFTFVNDSTGQTERHCQGGMECKWSFAIQKTYFVRDGEVWTADSVVNSDKFKAVHDKLVALADEAATAFDIPRKQYVKMLNVAYTKALSASVMPVRD